MRAGVKKVRQTCNACRTRKVRCDGQRAGCASCRRLGFDCSFREDHGQVDSATPLRPPHRCRVRQACTSCHELKIRCSGSMPKCHRCSEKGIACLYPNSGSRRQVASVPALNAEPQRNLPSTTESGDTDNSQLPSPGGENAPPSTLASGAEQAEQRNSTHIADSQLLNLLTPERVRRALQSYFDHIYPLPTFSFLHKASLMRWNQSGQVDRCLLLSIVAINSRLPGSDPSEVDFGARCATLAQNLILRDQGRPNMIKTQSLFLIIRYRMWSGDTTEALMLMATLARFAFTLRLNYGNPTLCSLAQESRRRLMWAIYVLDTFLAGGLPEFTLCPSNLLHLPLPNEETTFELDTSYANVPLCPLDDTPGTASGDIGLLGYYVRVIYLRDSVLRRMKATVSSPQQPGTISTVTNDLKAQLDRFALNLPRSVTFSEINLQLRAYSQWLPRYIIMHLWLQQCYCDLYRCFFANLRESFPEDILYQLDPQFVLDCQTTCLQHARQITSICSLVRELGFENLILDMETAECVYQAGRILLHASQRPFHEVDPSEFSPVKPVNDCIYFIEQLASMFPTAAPIARDLSAILHDDRSMSLPSNDESNLPTSESGGKCGLSPANGRQIISKHSSLNRSKLNGDTISEDMPFLDNRPEESCTSAPAANEGVFMSPDTPAGSGSPSQRGASSNTITRQSFEGLHGFTLLPGGASGSNEQHIWDRTSAFEGAGDVAIFHPMYDQQDYWHALNFFPTHIDMEMGGD